MIDINDFHVNNGRYLREDDTHVNLGDYIKVTNGLAYAVHGGHAGVFATTVKVKPNQVCALNMFFDKPTVLSKVLLPKNGFTPITSVGLATGEYTDIVNSIGLNMTMDFDNFSQAQVVLSATNLGVAIGGNGIDNSILTDGATPLNVSFTNDTSETVDQKVIIKFFDVEETSTINLLTGDTQLNPDTEMSQYGAN